ncbi:MAG: MBL fold metallo-hydrolase [Deltaproteobacteria bacterium]|nr:MBL fold metallo-hydrolase [Deltaproteobacteria bacterium]MBW2051996.1 MBL fold metallo-hydrolase [Deltaproteobacteria bacterium]MBW2140081.1 MBL fold metallo-hydrolase [Deltaproteobacteria bacterium]MBW2323752.1 MBL fold metallo-hydrolase [Deltaproteobacteria bacterium]
MILKHLTVGPLMSNCFILGDEDSGEGVVIDPGGNAQEIAQELSQNQLTLISIVNTHGHWDHTGDNEALKSLAGGRVLIHEADTDQGIAADGYLAEGDRVRFGPHELEVLETPGHSPGGISLYFPEAGLVFVGDLLFAGSIGRTDIAGGHFNTLIKSVVEKIFPMPEETTVLPGHGPMTMVGREKQFNPFLKGVQ